MNRFSLSRRSASNDLQARGLPVAASILVQVASIGGEPAFQRFGRVRLYLAEVLARWAEAPLSTAVLSTFEPGTRVEAGDWPRDFDDVPEDRPSGRPMAVPVGAATSGRAVG